MKWRKGSSDKAEQFAFEEAPPVQADEPETESMPQPVQVQPVPPPPSAEEDPYLKVDSFEEPEAEPEPEDFEDPEPEPEVFDEPEPEVKPAPVPMRRRRSRHDEEEVPEEKSTGFKVAKSLELRWLRGHWKIIVILVFIFALGMFVRSYYGMEPATENGFLLSGGSDSYYHNYVIDWMGETGDHHFWDDMLNYPVGTRNPRPPFYDWSVGMGGIFFAPFFDGDVVSSTFYVFLLSTAFWGALTIFPVYFLAKEAFGKKTGMVAAFLLAIMPGHIQRSVMSNADHDAMALFFIVLAFYFFLRSLKLLKEHEWVNNWKSPSTIWGGMKDLVSSNKKPMLYAVLAGVSIASVSLIWKGYAYAIVILTVYLGVQVLINRFRNRDSTAVLMVYFITVGVGLLIAFPYYYLSIQIISWFDAPLVMFLAVTVFSIILIVTNKFPWVLVFSGMILTAMIVIFVLYFAMPSLLDSIYSALLSGAGYFVSNKQYQTIAEAQAPPFSNLALSFGIITFWLSFAGVAWAAFQLPKNMKADFIFILLWTGTSIYMAVTAARFMFNAAPAFAITSGWVVAIILQKLDIQKFFDQQRRNTIPQLAKGFRYGIIGAIVLLVLITIGLATMSNLALAVMVVGIGAIVGALMMNLIAELNPKRYFHLITVMVPGGCALFYLYAALGTEWVIDLSTHAFLLFTMFMIYFVLFLTIRRTKLSFTAGILFLAFFIITPNVWAGIDAGIPYETKASHDLEIYEAMPVFMQPDSYDAENGTNWFLGGFGYSLPLNSRYWPAAYDWLATQDTETYPASERPAFLSWWDYGFEVVNEGDHPTVADNFLGGHQLAGNFIMSQSEADAIGLLCARILEGDWTRIWDFEPNGLSDEVRDIVASYGLDTEKLDDILTNPTKYINEIHANPDIYGPRDDIIQAKNARYLATRGLITTKLDLEDVVSLYNDLCAATGNSIRYFGIDSRMFPFSAENTGIFYAPAKLSDHRINEVGNQPYDFWQIKVADQYGGLYDLDDIPEDITVDQEEPYRIVYNDMFYNSMLYKAFIGYSWKDVGREEDVGIPGLTGEMAQDPIMPGWNMSHFKLVHRTAYWNPYSAEEVRDHTDAWQAMNYYDAMVYQESGEGIADLSDRSSIYQGVMMLKYYDGAIISGTVTLEDGTPVNGARLTVSDDFGIPHHVVYSDEDGKYSLIAPFGDIIVTVSAGAVNPMTLLGAELNITQLHIEDYQAMREPEDRDSDGKFDYLIDLNPVILSGSISGSVYWDEDANTELGGGEDLIPNAELRMENRVLDMNLTAEVNSTGTYFISDVAPGEYDVDVYLADRYLGTHAVVVTSDQHNEQDIAATPAVLTGNVTYENGYPVDQATITAWIPGEGLSQTTTSNETGIYTFDTILYGSYSIKADMGRYSCPITRIEISKDLNNTRDLVLYESSVISGVVTLSDGSPAAGTNLRFDGTLDYVTTTDPEGNYQVALRDGTYDVIGTFVDDSDSYVNSIEVVMNGNLTQDMVLYTAYTENHGVFSITVPKGTYLVHVSSNAYELDWAYFKVHSFTTDSITAEYTLSEAKLIQGDVFWDMNTDNIKGVTEGIFDATVTFQSGLNTLITHTNYAGHFEASLHPMTTYQVTVSKTGFETVSLGSMSTEALATNSLRQILVPYTIPVSGTVKLDHKPLEDSNLMIKFTGATPGAENQNIQIHRDGTYSLDLLPGTYIVSFSQNISEEDITTVLQIVDEINFGTGYYDGTPKELDLEARNRIMVDVSILADIPIDANVTFKGPEIRDFTTSTGVGTFSVMQGDYVIYAASHTETDKFYVGMEAFTVALNNTKILLNMTEGFAVNGILAFKDQRMAHKQVIFQELSTNGEIVVYTDADAEYNTIIVPERSYNIISDFVAYDYEGDIEKPFRYFVNDSFYVTNGTPPAHSLTLLRENYYVELTGSVIQNYMPVAGAEIQFFSDSKIETVTDSDGKYTILISPGDYEVYIHDPSTHMVLLDMITIELEPVGDLDFELTTGYKLYGTTYYDLTKHQATELQFSSAEGTAMVTTGDDGFYQIWLTPGNYNITGISTVEPDNFVSFNYYIDTNLTFVNERALNLPMTMIEIPGVDIFWDPIQKITLDPEGSVTYDLKVTNTGNMIDTFRMTVPTVELDWTFSFEPSEITLAPGGSINVKLSIKTTLHANVDDGNLAVNARSVRSGATGTAVVELGITQLHYMGIYNSTASPKFNKGTLSWEFNVKNAGNGLDTFTVYIANKEALLESGWLVEFGTVDQDIGIMQDNNTRITNMSIGVQMATPFPITLTPVVDSPSTMANVLLSGYSQLDGSVTDSHHLVFNYPEIKIYKTNVTVTGDSVYDAPSGSQATNAGVMALTVASALLLFYVARKQRWIR